MSIKTFQDILPLIEQPSRYLGSEINTIKKDPGKIKLNFALVFPDLYEIGTSHFGLQILYSILNKKKEMSAERVFAPGADMEAHLRSADIPIMSLETKRPLQKFDIIGFSLLYELNYTNILNILDLAKIPFLSRQRDDSHALIIAGGPCTCNPEPVADFFDAMVIGDGESVILEIADAWVEWKENFNGGKESLLRKLSKIEGVYVPSFFKAEYDRCGFQTLLPKYPEYTKIKRRIEKDLDGLPFPETPIIPYSRPVHDRLRIEVARGCSGGCRFCQAGMIYRPVRERSVETLLSLSETSIEKTGYEDISLLSLSTGDYKSIIPLMERLMEGCETRHIAVSLPSLRAGTLTPELMRLIKKVRKTGFTIAPEAGSQRLRKFINKNISEKEIIETVQDSFDLGWQVIKLYFMIGLPSERKEDIQGIVDLVKKLRKIKGEKGRWGKINAGVSTFIPKPHTPFQWEPLLSLNEAKERIKWIKGNLEMPGIRFKWHNPETSMIEGLFARGNRQLSRLLISAHRKGCKFDSWSDEFDFELWKEACKDTGVDINHFNKRKRDLNELLPWDHIDIGVTKEFLKKEWEKAKNLEFTPDCRKGDCNDCGVCDFRVIAPKIFEFQNKERQKKIEAENNIKKVYKKLKISYSKKRQAKYFGHLELVNIFIRAINRAKIDVKYSQGFHPKPKVSFEDPLPLGMESQMEFMYINVLGNVKCMELIERLNQNLPDGIKIQGCQVEPRGPCLDNKGTITYQVLLKEGFFDEKALKNFADKAEVVVKRLNKKGKLQTINLKDAVMDFDLISKRRLIITLKSDSGKKIRPNEVIKKVFNLSDEQVKQSTVLKLKNNET